MPDTRKSLGSRGEEIAVKFLKKNRYKILERNYKSKLGEIDIIARDKDTLCFIEVKTRKNAHYGLPQEAVDKYKRSRLIKAALFYMKEKKLSDCSFRFDVIAVTDQIRLIKNAFSMERKYSI